MPRLLSKSFEKPDRTRALGNGRLEIVDLDETTVGRVTLPAGWRWSTDVRPVVGTASCQTRHVAYTVSGTLHVVMDDGTELDIQKQAPHGHEDRDRDPRRDPAEHAGPAAVQAQ